MENVRLDEDQNNMNEKPSVSNEDLNDIVSKLFDKIDKLSDKIDSLEAKLSFLQGSDFLKLAGKTEVEIEEHDETEEDYLTPADIVFENDALQLTGMKLIKLRIATASEIANITQKDRAVESFYLNDLWNRNKIRKLRIGRKVYFYAGKASEIKPFKHSSIKAEWRELLVSIIQNIDSFEVNKKISFSKLVESHLESSSSDDSDPDSSEKSLKVLESQLKKKLQVIANQTKFLKILDTNPKDIKIEFIAKEWMNLQ